MGKTKNIKKIFIKSLPFLVITALIYTMIWTAIHGIPMMKMPKQQDIKGATITYHKIETQEISDPKQLEILVNSANLLRYRLVGETKGEPVVSVCYH